ncbi:hypothetical protein [Nocardioides sp.]|uniref:hypothetical protein n=1 Tax=Nocardioides sp. TaxID=35761 RepID=UPI002736CB56|nr:hypothetical protein [Nocardioides sp.]MDP3891583.1 hypothetical protein [Nocardioides sp.]
MSPAPLSPQVRTALRSASVAELAWVDPQRGVVVRGVVPLLPDDTGDGAPVLAFTWAEAELARSVGAADEVVLTLTDPRCTGAGFSPTLLRATPALREDRTGEAFTDGLLREELRRYPPARRYADSPLLERENWWYLPRLQVTLEVHSTSPFAARTDPGHGLLVVDTGQLVAVVAAPEHADDGTAPEPGPDVLRPRLSGGVPPAPGPAVLFGHDLSYPDMEQWAQWAWRGQWDGDALRVTERPPRTGLGRTPTLRQRWRSHRELERRCRRALEA